MTLRHLRDETSVACIWMARRIATFSGGLIQTSAAGFEGLGMPRMNRSGCKA